MLPEVVTVFRFPIRWKAYVSEELFVQQVSDYYDKLVEQYHLVQHAVLREMVESINTELPEGCVSYD